MSINILISLVLGLVGLIGILLSCKIISRAIDSEGWAVVEGNIVESLFDKSMNNDLQPIVKYQYFVEGKSFENDVVKIGMKTMLDESAERVVTN